MLLWKFIYQLGYEGKDSIYVVLLSRNIRFKHFLFHRHDKQNELQMEKTSKLSDFLSASVVRESCF
jgi:hypothetical protein